MTQSKYHFSGFTFNPEEHSLKKPNGKTIFLNRRLYELLLVFVEHPHSVFSVDELIKRIWKSEVGNSTVSSWINRLRNKLGENARRQRIIKTINGSGYTLAADVTIEERMDTKAVAVVNQSQASEYAGIHQELAEIKSALRVMGMEISLLKNLISRIMLYTKSDLEKAKFLIDTVEWANQRLIGPEQDAQVATLAAIDDDLIWALDYLSKTSPQDELKLAGLMSRYWLIQGRWVEGCQRLRAALSHQQVESGSHAFALAWLSHLAYSIDDYKLAEKSASASVRLSKRIGDEQSLAFAYLNQGAVAAARGQYQYARSSLYEGLQISQRAGIKWMIAWTSYELGRLTEAEEFYGLSDSWFRRSLVTPEELQNFDGVALIQASLGSVALAQGKIEDAKDWTDKSFASLNKEVLACSYTNLGMLDLTAGHYKPAFDNFRKAFLLREQINDKRGMARASEAMAKCKEAMGEDKEAARLYGSAFTIRKSISAPLSPAERKSYGASIEAAKKRDFAEFQSGALKLS